MVTVNWEATNHKLKSEIKNAGISTKELASFMKLSSRTIQGWLANNNDRHPSIEQMSLICCCIEKGLDELIVLNFQGSEVGKDQEIYAKMIGKNNRHITTLEEFLLYLPLIKIETLIEALSDKTLQTRNDLLSFTEKMYESIDEESAKKYADLYREFFIKYPSVRLLGSYEDRDTEKLTKYKEMCDNGSLDDLRKCYNLRKNKSQKFLLAIKEIVDYLN